MTLFLASVRDAAEAELALGEGTDVIDLKDPARGALGALAAETITACLRCVAGRAPVSATVGDLPLRGDAVAAAVSATAALGVDYIKLGVFPGSDASFYLDLADREPNRARLILVLFADALPQFDSIALAAKLGASGLMFDTLGKGEGALTDYLPLRELAARSAEAKTCGLTVGFAGSLRPKDVPALLALEPDLLGFRGALCRNGDRLQPVDAIRLASIRKLIPRKSGGLLARNLPDRAAPALC